MGQVGGRLAENIFVMCLYSAETFFRKRFSVMFTSFLAIEANHGQNRLQS